MAVLLLALSGCASTTNPVAAALSSPISVGRTLHAPAGSTTLTSQDCAVPAARAVAAAAALLPAGTSRMPQHTDLCTDDQPLNVTFPALGELTWAVTVKVTAGTAADCQSGASNAGATCGPVVGHPAFIGAEAVCSAIACDQAWVFRGAHLAVVSGYVPGSQPGMSQRAIPAFNGLGTVIGVSVLSALGR